MKVKFLEYKESSGIFFTEPSRTKQSDMEACDLNIQLAKFERTGLMGNFRADAPLEGDFSDVENLMDAANRMTDLQEQFMLLPAKLRKQFDNDPFQMLQWLQDKDNYEEAVKYGLLVEKAPEPVSEPAVVVSDSVPPSGDN